MTLFTSFCTEAANLWRRQWVSHTTGSQLGEAMSAVVNRRVFGHQSLGPFDDVPHSVDKALLLRRQDEFTSNLEDNGRSHIIQNYYFITSQFSHLLGLNIQFYSYTAKVQINANKLPAIISMLQSSRKALTSEKWSVSIERLWKM